MGSMINSKNKFYEIHFHDMYDREKQLFQRFLRDYGDKTCT